MRKVIGWNLERAIRNWKEETGNTGRIPVLILFDIEHII